MKKYFIPCMLLAVLASATSATAQHWRRFTDDRFEPRYYHDRYYHHDEKKTDEKKTSASEKDATKEHDYDCYDAWRKNMKSEKKVYKAREAYYDDRPEAAERKMYKAEKKAWKSDRKEHFHESYDRYWHDRYNDDPYWER